MQYSFLNDYSEGCHPKILAEMNKHNLTQKLGYGADLVCQQAKKLLMQKAQSPKADVYFVSGGTQANLICLAAMLKPFEAVISASTGHIAVNEAGAIEATGHKIISMPSKDGKLTTKDITQAVTGFSKHPHTVRPKVAYITNATELGTVYTKAELTALSTHCHKNDLYLFMDGARLGAGLASEYSDLTLVDIAKLTDIFWLGGTKMGALLGEAIMINHDDLKADFGFHVKQRGAMLAKGSLLGIQFVSLLKQDLYVQLSKHANKMAAKLATGINNAGYELMIAAQSNQVFAMLPHELVLRLQHEFMLYEWERQEKTSLVRLVTSWATDEAQVDKFLSQL